ncbi:MAG: tetratricopeptide repeat protein [Ignavibacteriaceae bacterium]|jgi:tetratricopeptide (TPR) repeat protein|nr:tetratricopeptide repeat protein [Ignavibacteriaceae bacterium]
MKRVNIFTAIVLGAFLTFTGFQCSSTELTSAKLYIQQKNWDKAIDVLNKEVTKNPKSDEGYYLLGAVYAEKENIDQMIENYDKSLEISKKYEKEIKSAKKYHWANFFNKGVAFFNRAAQQTNPDSAALMNNKSTYAFDQAIKLEPDSLDSYKNLAYVYMNMQKFDDAIPNFMKLIEKQKSPDAYKYVGQIYYNKGVIERDKYENSKVAADSLKALDYFNKAIVILEEGKKVLPNDSEVLLYLSNSYIAANKVDVAIDAFKAGVVAEPNNKFYRYNYGVLLLGDNQFEAAADQFKKAVDIDPTYQNAIYNLAVTYVKWGAKIAKDHEVANKDNKEAKEETQSKEKYKAALPYLESYVQKKTDDAQIWELLGKVYTVMGMPNDASNAFKKADAIRKGK